MTRPSELENSQSRTPPARAHFGESPSANLPIFCSRLDLMETVGLLRQVTAEIVTSADLDQALGRLADLAADLVPAGWCGIAVLRDGKPRLAARSEDLPLVLEEEQYRRGEGPCLTAMCERDIVVSADLRNERRWPVWCRMAARHGARAVACYPLNIDAQVFGALNIYRTTDAPTRPDDQLKALLVAEQASLLLGAVLDRSRDRARLERLVDAADPNRSGIYQAVGILMAQRGCDQREALSVLEEAADAVGADLAAVAAKLVSTVATRAKKAHQ
jgi:GAF domain-containing protein